MVAGAIAISIVEKMLFADTLYFAFVSGLTIGYVDIVVKTPVGRLIALLIGFVGDQKRTPRRRSTRTLRLLPGGP